MLLWGLVRPNLGVCQTGARQLPDSCQTAARQLGAIQIWSAECRAAFWRAISITHVAFLWTRFNSLWQERSVRDCLQYAANPAHPRGIVRSKIGAKEASSWIHDIRRTQRSFQRRPLRAPTSCVPSTCALGCGDRRSGNKTRSQALRLSGSAGCTKATPAAHRAGTIDRRPKSRSDIAADEPAFKGDVAISRSRFRAV